MLVESQIIFGKTQTVVSYRCSVLVSFMRVYRVLPTSSFAHFSYSGRGSARFAHSCHMGLLLCRFCVDIAACCLYFPTVNNVVEGLGCNPDPNPTPCPYIPYILSLAMVSTRYN